MPTAVELEMVDPDDHTKMQRNMRMTERRTGDIDTVNEPVASLTLRKLSPNDVSINHSQGIVSGQ
jgi:hypothetical protein